MFIEAKAGQREMGQHEVAGSVLLSDFAREAYQSLEHQQQEFAKLAEIVRKFSDNFVPEIFARRNNQNLPEGCLDKLLDGNERAYRMMVESFERLSENGLQPYEAQRDNLTLCEEEEQRLKAARIFMVNWRQMHPAPSQRDHKAA